MELFVRLHLGCGTRRAGLDGFIHVDIRPEVQPDIVADFTCLDGKFKNQSAELIYWCHGLEHVPRPLVIPTLTKLYNILTSGGILRLSMPDFRVMASLYVTHGFRLDQVIGPIIGRQDYPENTHYSIYDIESLSAILIDAGFEHIREYDPRQVWPKEFDDYSLAVMDGRLISLNVECNRP